MAGILQTEVAAPISCAQAGRERGGIAPYFFFSSSFFLLSPFFPPFPASCLFSFFPLSLLTFSWLFFFRPPYHFLTPPSPSGEREKDDTRWKGRGYRGGLHCRSRDGAGGGDRSAQSLFRKGHRGLPQARRLHDFREVICGFGRLGTTLGCQSLGLRPTPILQQSPRRPDLAMCRWAASMTVPEPHDQALLIKPPRSVPSGKASPIRGIRSPPRWRSRSWKIYCRATV